MFSFVPSAITQPFFELQTPDFAWKFVWTVPTNYEKKLLLRIYVITYLQPTQNKVYYLKFGQNLDQIFLFSKKIEFNQNVRLPLNSIQTF